jgi:hypothetical protein
MMEKKHIMSASLGVLALVAIVLLVRAFTAAPPTADLATEVIIRYEDSGDEVKMPRGQFERELLARLHQKEPIDPAVGLTNPKTGKPTGFPADRDFWNKMIDDVKKMKAQK